ncbi:GAF domain-containing protein [Vibrio sp. 03_296]|uniref:GAF domain-containing protein n=1 Tax=Vibrio sp. 03_296 TaxID=2024409 RepID=UPI002D802895|nr:GAF domain-containing protein [Vibrio sp. 03_296]
MKSSHSQTHWKTYYCARHTEYEEIFQADRSSIALRENDAYLKLYALDGNDVLPKDCLIPIQSSFVGQVFSQQKTAISPDNRKSNMIDCQWLVDGGLLCCMDTPLKYKEECYGTLNVAHKQVDSYSEIDAKILETIAKWVAAQIYKHKQINKMIELAHLDPLTGALNRRAFVEATYFINDKPRQYDHKTDTTDDSISTSSKRSTMRMDTHR